MLTKDAILKLFNSLNEELARQDIKGEIYLVGGAVMTLVFDARASTRDIDALFLPATTIRNVAFKIASKHSIDINWLNDAVKGFMSECGEFNEYLELSHLRLYTALPEYLLAMKCLSMRLGPEFHDEADIRYLLRFLNIEKYEEALAIISRYFPLERFMQKSLYALEEILI
ncbi:MAG: hypothetical protein JW841_11610 [Deltaproteobacteria bacterium]|nr:hypothetical protein [Deltaproteobacteria bacterium]